MTKIFLKCKRPLGTLNHEPKDQQPGILTNTPENQLWVGNTKRLSVTFSQACLFLNSAISSHSANLIQSGKNTNAVRCEWTLRDHYINRFYIDVLSVKQINRKACSIIHKPFIHFLRSLIKVRSEWIIEKEPIEQKGLAFEHIMKMFYGHFAVNWIKEMIFLMCCLHL